MKTLVSIKIFLVITLSFLIAIILAILPLPKLADWFRPEWVLLVMIYWSLVIPSKVSVGVAWLVGILLDVLYNLPIGQTSLALVLVTYLTVKFHGSISFFTFWQKLLVIFGLTLFYLLLMLYLQSRSFPEMAVLICFTRSLASTVIWLWLALILSDYQHRFEIESDNI